jgi:hypothetical protein
MDRRASLDALGFSWVPYQDDFAVYVELLKAFVHREGHGRVPQKHIEEGKRLGAWVANLRNPRTKLSRERKTILSKAGFSWKASR